MAEKKSYEQVKGILQKQFLHSAVGFGGLCGIKPHKHILFEQALFYLMHCYIGADLRALPQQFAEACLGAAFLRSLRNRHSCRAVARAHIQERVAKIRLDSKEHSPWRSFFLGSRKRLLHLLFHGTLF